MIIGLGTDIVEIDRIEKAAACHGVVFIRRFLTEKEWSEAQKHRERNTYAAGRWAAKEAISKMLGCGIGARCSWQEIEISNNPSGAPEVILSGNARKTAAALGIVRIFLSISHERHYAAATAVGEG